MEQVEFGIVTSIVPIDIDGTNINDVKKAYIITSQDEYLAYIKRMKNETSAIRSLYIECICAIIGRYFNLPIPKPLVVKVTHENFDDIPFGSHELAFGAIDLKHPSFRRYICDKLPKDEIQRNLDKLKSFGKIADIGIFDEFIGNNDRHSGNILFDGKEFCFIDHDQAIPKGLKAYDAASNNIIIEAVYKDRSDSDKINLIQNVRAKIEAYNSLLFDTLSDKINPEYLDGFTIEEADEIINFLTERPAYLPRLFESRLCIQPQPQQELIL